MLISLINDNQIINLRLPNKYYGVYWVTDYLEGNEKALVSIEAENEKWKLQSNSEVTIVENGIEREFKYLEEYSSYNLYDKKEKKYYHIYCSPIYDKSYEKYYLNHKQISIGTNEDCAIHINSPIFNGLNAILSYDNGFFISNNNSKIGVYANNSRVIDTVELSNGDTIFINGIKIIVLCEDQKPVLVINNPNRIVDVKIISFTKIVTDDNNLVIDNLCNEDARLYTDNDFFHKKPRFKESISCINIEIDAPPAKAKNSDMPLILQVGPMLTGSAISMLYGYMTISNLIKNGKNWTSAWPSFLVCILSLMASLVWPIAIRRYTKYKTKKVEKVRVKKYNEYLQSILETIDKNSALQKRILIQNSPSLTECITAIETKNNTFWNRKTVDDDFLNVSLGIGNIPMQINIKVPEVHFSLDKDELLEKISKMKFELPTLTDVPVVYNFIEKKVTATIGELSINKKFVDRIIFQLSALHSYDDLKIVYLGETGAKNESDWGYLKILPHCWSNDKSVRYYGNNKDDVREVCYHLEAVFNQRLSNENKKNSKIPYYLIVTDNYKSIRNFELIKKILDVDENLGFGLLILNDKVFNLPANCNNFINVNKGSSEIFQNILNSNVQKFNIDFDTNIDMWKYSKIMANIPIEFNDDNGELPNSIGFLELYNVGKIEQLNVLNRWKDNNPILSLQSLIGVGKGGEKIYLDLHEKYHGPHGLIAGMTGSGKSEFIATYILSLAVNYHPNEVQFILIDYKGGGLAGIFENKLTGVKLPHLIGTITNLDTNEIKRSLSSIESELMRRQIIFGKVREQTGDSVVDIYKYQQLYREGVISEPMSHLFIICDEFAELKAQQLEFLQQLISISRIGRSLGIHLILATQKPSGVVDNQIWSNSKFRVCLRVQEKSDSSEVIKCPDAAFLSNAGRFYLQVGYNEVFLCGQAAWGGGRYIPTDKVKKKIDTNVEFINNLGYIIKKGDTKEKQLNEINYGEEIKNIIIHLQQLAIDEQIQIQNLWLDKIPSHININDLKRKYNFMKQKYILDVPIGEYDIPNKQKQELMTIPFSKIGNVIVYGSPGSGKENLITTLLYSSVTSYTPYDVIYYVLDFGTETLKVFSGIPHIGDVILPYEQEKVKNLFKMLFFMIEERKNLFSNYNGDYTNYCMNSGNTVPNVVLIINNYDSYCELYPMYEDSLIQITREGAKFGIYCLITISNASNIRFKLRQNFKGDYVLQQNNEADYSNILGSINKQYPSKIFGRGIFKDEEIYEFQTAMVTEPANLYNYINEIKNLISNNSSIKAVAIPTLPNVVTREHIDSNLQMNGVVALGIEKENLNIVSYDFRQNYITLFLSYDLSCICNSFLNPFVKQLVYKKYFDLIIINCEDISIDKQNYIYYDNDFDSIFEKLYNYVEKNNQLYLENGFSRDKLPKNNPKLCIIIGLDTFKNKLNSENNGKFVSLFEKGKDLDLINYIFIDSVDKIKKYEYDSWYKTVVNNTKGLFFGNGLADQMTIKVTKNDRSFRDDIPENFCYVINHGRPVLIKFVESFENDEI